jgi:hypothetical protein
MNFDPVAFERRRRTFEDAGRVTCPCCGYPTIDTRATFEICSLCAWEDDGQDDAGRLGNEASAAPDVVTMGPNHDYSLTEARHNFAANVTSYRPSDRDFEVERASTAIKREIVAAFERAVSGLTDLERADEDARYFFARLYGIS